MKFEKLCERPSKLAERTGEGKDKEESGEMLDDSQLLPSAHSLFIWLHWAFVVVCGFFSWDMQGLPP